MKQKLKIKYTNELDIRVFDDSFYQLLLDNIIKLKEEQSELSKI